MDLGDLKAKIVELSKQYSRQVHVNNRPGDDPLRSGYDPAVDGVPYAGRVFDEDEVAAAVDSLLDFWLTLGPQGELFERELADFLGVRASVLVNSGSSANLVAFSTLTSPKLPKAKRILPGDEVITAAAGFPTTVAPIIQCGAVPVFIDVNPLTANADCSQLELAYRHGKTKAVFMAHALGNPFDIREVLRFCRKYDLWLIEDNCDALGSTYSMPVRDAEELGLNHLLKAAVRNQGNPDASLKLPRIREGNVEAYTGSFGDLSTQSFYPPHHLTTGEGGAVNIVSQAALKPIVESFRDWGRDCWCPSGKDNTCNKRFGWQLGELPSGYDHKYIYSHLGYNLKPLDLQAAIGRVQLEKLRKFIVLRKENWEFYRKSFEPLNGLFDYQLPTHATSCLAGDFIWDGSQCVASCSWFGFMLLVKEASRFSRTDLANFLQQNKVGNRMFFGGNLTRQPVFVELIQSRPSACRVVGELKGADTIMNTGLFIGVYPGLTATMRRFVVETIMNFAADTSR
jgi:CDP-6-deoxy-D-xylo-4-hexulose-3-dehydrase